MYSMELSMKLPLKLASLIGFLTLVFTCLGEGFIAQKTPGPIASRVGSWGAMHSGIKAGERSMARLLPGWC
jgi:hypothetical protein